MGRLKHQDNVGRNLQSFGSVTPCLVELNNQNTVVKVFRYQIEKDLETICIEVGELIKEVFSSGWLNHAIEVGCFELLRKVAGRIFSRHTSALHLAFGLHPSSCDFAATDGLESDAGFIFTQEAHLPAHPHHGDRHPSQQG
jgi:hypothetical protein